MKTLKKNYFTIIELVIVIGMIFGGLIGLSIVGTVLYIAYHFISKIW